MKRQLSNSFSLLEIMIVIALLIILISLNITLQSSASSLVRSDIQTIASVIQYVQYVAMNSMQPHEISFDVRNKSYTYEGITKHLSPGVEFAIHSGVKGPPSCPTHELVDPITFEQHHIQFNAQGVCTSGSIYLTDTQRTCLYALTVPIGYTVYPHIYYFGQKWFELT